MALYPPILESSQDAFVASLTPSVLIYFTLSTMTNIKDIRHVQIKIVYQSNNKSAIGSSSPDGILYKNFQEIISYNNGLYAIPINTNELQNGQWLPNKYYKVQICFGENPLWTNKADFASWKSKQILTNAVSEWSTVMILKAINEPKFQFMNSSRDVSERENKNSLASQSALSTVRSTTPLFEGFFSCEGEPEDLFRFCLYYKDVLIETSDWLQHDSSGGVDTYRFKQVLNNRDFYKATYEIITVNKYKPQPKEFEFMVERNFLTRLEGVHLLVEDATNQDEPYSDENGVLNVYLSTDASISGNYVLTRSDEKSDFAVWEDIKFFVFLDDQLDKELIFQDFTIESGIKYKYAFQQQNIAGLRTSPVYEVASPYRMSNFQYSYLFADGVQLKLKFDNKISSFKHTVLSSKQDTLGSHYPTIYRNGDAYYAEFPISGLISLHMDNDETFFTLGNDGSWYYKGEKIIDKEKHLIEEDINTFDTDLTDNNLFIERMFRNKVEEFLNDGGYKLYKSPTEGNFVVTLMNVTLTPNQTLGRMIYSFSATAYEVLDNTLENLNEYGIIDIGEFQTDITDVDEAGHHIYTVLFGQISGLYDPSINLVDVIKQQNEYDIGGGYQYRFEGLASFQIEAYPNIKFTDKINELNAKLISAKTDGNTKLMEEILKEKEELEKLEAAIDSQVEHPIITVYINGKEISLGSNRIYQLKDDETVSSISLKPKYCYKKNNNSSGFVRTLIPTPIIVNYTCYVSVQESETNAIEKIRSKEAWGQVAGVFTDTERVLDNYQLNRPKTYKVSDEFHYDLYQSLNLTDIIKDEVRKCIEREEKVTFVYDETFGQWTSKKFFYVFQEFLTIEIEGEEGTTLLITNKEDKVQQEVIIGDTNKYRLEEAGDLISDIQLQKPSSVIVNYNCLVLLLERREKE